MRRSSLTWLLSLTFLSGLTNSLVIPVESELNRRPGADFHSVRTRLHKDYSWRRPEQPTKYFHEAVFSNHYDGRFGDRQLKYVERRAALSSLIRSYLQTMASIQAETWIVHGTLIGWWWNQQILPWDSDIDVMVSEDTMNHLAKYYNMTVHGYTIPITNEGRDYMLEINPHYKETHVSDQYNKIDGRWVDMTTGMYIDITTARSDEVDGVALLTSRDGHTYKESDVFPLRESRFEDTPVRVPYAYEELLRREYGEKAMTDTYYEEHVFDRTSSQWVSLIDIDEMDKEIAKPTVSKFVPASRPDVTRKQWRPEHDTSPQPIRDASRQIRKGDMQPGYRPVMS